MNWTRSATRSSASCPSRRRPARRRRRAPADRPDALGINLPRPPGRQARPRDRPQKEIERVIQIRCKTKNNPALIGEPGEDGDREGLAHRTSPATPASCSTSGWTSLIARRRHQVPRRVRGAPKKIIEELRNTNDAILFIDELHTLVGAARPRARSTPPTSRRRCAASSSASARLRRRVPQVHREGRGPRAALQPVMVEEPRQSRPSRSQASASATSAPHSPDHRRRGAPPRPSLDPLHHRPPPTRRSTSSTSLEPRPPWCHLRRRPSCERAEGPERHRRRIAINARSTSRRRPRGRAVP